MIRMVQLMTVRSEFEGRVLVARLGADGIVAELRGPGLGVYPVGDVHLWVESAQADVARELLQVARHESASARVAPPPRPASWRPIAVTVAVSVLIGGAFAPRCMADVPVEAR